MYTPIPLTSVSISDIFWAPIQAANRQHTLPIEYQQCKDTGRIDSFRLDWKPGQPNPPHIFWDSDVAKWIEACSYSLSTHPDPDLETLLDEVIALIAAAQQPDGYLNVHFTVVEPEKRWTNLRDWHELYCAGHMIEAGVAHFQATAKRSLLDVVCRYADYIASVFGREAGQKRGYPGHEEIELALVKLWRATGQVRYRELAQYFIDERGQKPYYYDEEAIARGEDPAAYWAGRGLPLDKRYSYTQAHLPVRQQNEVTGHAVRAMYLYSAMADLANASGDEALHRGDEGLRRAGEALWQDVCLKKMYITGGIGPSRHNEGFTKSYDLPNETAYAETCAAIGLVFWNHRLLQQQCERRYADVMERALYNGVISGVSRDGEKFFYENPLASQGQHHRQAWFDCACCPPNIARLLAALGNYVYSQDGATIAVHLFIQGEMQTEVAGQTLKLRQETRYPWEGAVRLEFGLSAPAHFVLKLRLPGWCQGFQLHVNGSAVKAPLEHGYLRLERTWKDGDVVSYDMAMPIERIYAHPLVAQDTGRVALQRGPLVYCLEQVDHTVPVEQIALPRQAELQPAFNPDLLGGVVTLGGSASVAVEDGWEGSLYQVQPAAYQPCQLNAIPYFAWDNRQAGAMCIWLPEI